MQDAVGKKDTVWKIAQWFFLTVGVLSVGYWASVTYKANRSQIEGARQLEHATATTAAPSIGDIVGRVEIPRLKLSTVVFEGADADVLERGAGHIPGSALPGDRGNTVLAAHRDTFFRPLRGIRVGDVVKVRRAQKYSSYIVQSARVVGPNEVDVMK